ncbi:probable sodium/potassium/calcium exchanger CG1090 [Daktulosphaira vitifoliae]|uniref:probable sodium/potassium/calcium exchanger CG1090 n=1 Tax=Daktulosphaira vitifoliae TaxID=58002 RepID=UPI0021A9F1A5|nr:probable sodium/potassium/calcium exchanger CG1090 [Daktulosphaira vitifoliae]
MIRQRRPSRSRSIILWGGFLLLYAALTAIIDCTISTETNLTITQFNEEKQYFTPITPLHSSTLIVGDSSLKSPKKDVSTTSVNDLKVSLSLPVNSTISNVTTTETSEICTPPAIKQFPRPFMRPHIRRRGGVIFHIILCIYSFLGLAIVCDHYFVKSLDRICEELKVSPDVAGATFMAAGSSAPELATVIIGVFLAKDDIGVSGVIGSAVFNIMFVIAICGLASTTVTYLNWWPLCRDSFFYTISILIMLLAIYNETITWMESSLLLLTYVIYCVALYYNLYLEAWANTWNLPFPPRNHGQINELFTEKTVLEGDGEKVPEQIQLTGTKSQGYDTTGSTGLDQQELNQEKSKTRPQNPDFYVPKEYQEDNEPDPLVKPNNATLTEQIQWAVLFPIYYLCHYTMPDCRKEQFKSWYILTFIISMFWISVYSYIMVWMITVIGNTLGIPDTVMGLTFVAAGVSVPDALSSLAVVKEGYGDMAVSNAVGSNVFDILVCLGLPWFLQTAIFNPGSTVKVYSKGLTYCTLTLLSTVVFLLVATHMNGWKLDRKFGAVLMLWYLIFIAIASLYELNGTMNPPSCLTDY